MTLNPSFSPTYAPTRATHVPLFEHHISLPKLHVSLLKLHTPLPELHMPPSKTFKPTHLILKAPTNPSLPPLPSSTTVNVSTHRFMFCHLSSSSHHHFCRPTCMHYHPLTLFQTTSYHVGVWYPYNYSTFEVRESSTHSNPNVPTFSSSNITHQQLDGLR